MAKNAPVSATWLQPTRSSAASSLSTTLMPISESIAFMSSIWSEVNEAAGMTALISSMVT